MAEFSAVDAATEGLRLIWKRPKILGIWTGAYLLFYVALFVVALLLIGGAALSGMGGGLFANPGETPDLDALASMIVPLVLMIIILIPVSLIFSAMLNTAMQRVTLRPEDGGLGYLKVGPDEFRQVGLYILMGLLLLGGYLAAGIVVFVLSLVHVALAVVGGIAAFFALAYVAIRLSLAVPMTFATRKIDIFGSWTLSKGRFWPMLGAYLLAFVILFGLIIAGSIIMFILMLMVGGTAMVGAAGGGEVATGGAVVMTIILQFLNVIFQALFGAITIAIAGGVSAAIYRDVAVPEAVKVF